MSLLYAGFRYTGQKPARGRHRRSGWRQSPEEGRAAVVSTTGPTMKLSRTVSYAVRATLQLAQNGSSAPVPCSKLASEGEMPERFLLADSAGVGDPRNPQVDAGRRGRVLAFALPGGHFAVGSHRGDRRASGDGGRVACRGQPADVQQLLQTALRQVTSTARQQLESIKLSQLLPPPTHAVCRTGRAPAETHPGEG